MVARTVARVLRLFADSLYADDEDDARATAEKANIVHLAIRLGKVEGKQQVQIFIETGIFLSVLGILLQRLAL